MPKFKPGDIVYSRNWKGLRRLTIVGPADAVTMVVSPSACYETVGDDGIHWTASERVLLSRDEAIAYRLAGEI
jgi:hypothetical protein